MTGASDPDRGPGTLLEPFLRDPAGAAILLDFDGTLAPIVERPEEAAPAPGAGEVIERLVARFGTVVVVTGRPAEEVERRLPMPGLRVVGLYGLDAAAASTSPALREALEAAAAEVPGAWVEGKGLSLAVHYRQAKDPEAAAASLRLRLGQAVAGTGHEVIAGKMVLEVVPAGESRKGGVVRRLVEEADPGAVLYAGDDLADLEAFAELDLLREDGRGRAVLKVAVGGREAPPDLLAEADLVLANPAALVGLLRALVDQVSPGEPSG